MSNRRHVQTVIRQQMIFPRFFVRFSPVFVIRRCWFRHYSFHFHPNHLHHSGVVKRAMPLVLGTRSAPFGLPEHVTVRADEAVVNGLSYIILNSQISFKGFCFPAFPRRSATNWAYPSLLCWMDKYSDPYIFWLILHGGRPGSSSDWIRHHCWWPGRNVCISSYDYSPVNSSAASTFLQFDGLPPTNRWGFYTFYEFRGLQTIDIRCLKAIMNGLLPLFGTRIWGSNRHFKGKTTTVGRIIFNLWIF